MAQYMLSSHRNVFIFTRRIHLIYKKAVYKVKYILTPFLKVFFCVERFRPIIRLANNSQEKFRILNVPHVGSLCFLDSDKSVFCRELGKETGD